MPAYKKENKVYYEFKIPVILDTGSVFEVMIGDGSSWEI